MKSRAWGMEMLTKLQWKKCVEMNMAKDFLKQFLKKILKKPVRDLSSELFFNSLE